MIQCAAVIVVAELIARFLPLPLRKKSSKNCYRFDGSLSESRRVRERRAHLRFRRDLWLLLAIALLVGNVLVSVCTSYGIPLQQLFEGNFAAATVNTIGALAGILIFCGVPLLFGLRWAIRNFSQGVERRRAEHEALDTSRMNISGSEFSAQLLSSQQSANQPVAIQQAANQPVANQAVANQPVASADQPVAPIRRLDPAQANVDTQVQPHQAETLITARQDVTSQTEQ